MKNYQGVIFDMDGLLFDTEKVYLEVNVRLAPDFGLNGLDHAYMMTLVGLSDSECYERYLQDFEAEEETLQRFVQAGHEEVRHLFSTGQVPMKEGARELLMYLSKKNIPCVIASSNLREFIDILVDVAEIGHYFKGIVSANDVARAKPDPEIVIKATQLLGLDATQCLMVEDSLNGVRAAYGAGVDVIVVPDLVQPNDEMLKKALTIVPHLDNLQTYV